MSPTSRSQRTVRSEHRRAPAGTADTPPASLTPRPHQQAALDDLAAALAEHPRVQLHAACGTGKTALGAWAAAHAGSRLTAVFVPSLALVEQTARAWSELRPSLRMLLVCSDPTTAAGVAERGEDTVDPFTGRRDDAGSAGPAVTTQPGVLARFLDDTAEHGPGLVISTYHSAPVVAEALSVADLTGGLDLLIADEAHQLAGKTAERFAPVLRDSAIPARRRVFMTATPVLLGNLADDAALDDLETGDDAVGLLSMDDETVFGPVAHSLPAGAAIAAGLLADYRVVVVAGDRGDDDVASGLAALLDAARRHGLRRVLTFHNRVAAAHAFARDLTARGHLDAIPIRAAAVDGTMPAARIRAALAALSDDASANCLTVVSSARCLREGVDIPAVDAVLFADPRSSTVDIVQAVGRALRRHPDKDLGTIVIPLPLTDRADDDEQLATSDYAHVWRVLRGLRAHDARVTDDLRRAIRSLAARDYLSPREQVVPWLDVAGVDGDDLASVLTRLVRGSSAVWERCFALLEQVVAESGTAASVVTGQRVGGVTLGMWVGRQRWLHERGLLDPEKARRLEALAGWTWSSRDAADSRSIDVLAALAARTGTVAENPSGASAYAGLRCGLNRPLGIWCASARRRYRAGTFDRRLAARLDALHGWSWMPHTELDQRMLDAFATFVVWEKHGHVPADHVEGELELGRWVQGVRRRYLAGTLPAAVNDEILAIVPRGHKGAPSWTWDKAATQWELAVDALRRFVDRTGSAAHIPVGHTEDVDGVPVGLYQWAALQRHRYNKGELDPARATLLAAVPGWAWELPSAGRRALRVGDRLDLGDVPHGRRGLYAGCRCTECLEENRAYNRIWKQRKLAAERAHWQPADDLPARLRALLAHDDVSVGAVAAAAKVSRGLIRRLVAGADTGCDPVHAEALRRLTLGDVAAARSAPRSRGRLGLVGTDTVDPAPTWSAVTELRAAGWKIHQISAGLGYARLSSLPFTAERVTRAQADAVGELMARLGGDLTPPPAAPEQPRGRRDGGASKRAAEARALALLAQGYQIPHVADATGLSPTIVAALEVTARRAG